MTSANTLAGTVFDFEGWDGDVEYMTFYKAVFKKDFGPWKSGQKVDCITILYVDDDGPTMKEYNEDGDAVNQCHIKLAQA